MTNNPMKELKERREEVAAWLRTLQEGICTDLENADGSGRFAEDRWERPGGGGGHTRILAGGKVIEKGGVNFSAVYGVPPDSIVRQSGADPDKAREFFASGVSIVMHPQSPMVPIIHMNVRYFDLGEATWWVGGGIDLTPHYVVPEDASFFHQKLKEVCDRSDSSFYPEFKRWADDYFFIPHRNETRGVGGIFFDYLKDGNGIGFADRFRLIRDVGSAFSGIYTELMHRNRDVPYGEDQKQWQLLRRGRYAEFNLVYDRGTKFGLESNGRTESILMSLPPRAEWHYDVKPAEGSAEAQTLKWLRKGVDWINPPRS
jgi:coproporphyrinogen III oxidase